jgi:hypothetical protein
MKKVPFWLPLLLTLFAAFFGSAFFNSFPLLVFAPFLAIIFLRCSFIASLWIAALGGLLLDCISTEFRFGWQMIIYSITALVACLQKKHFFEDKPLSLVLYTIVISSLISTLQLVFLCFSKKHFPFDAKLLVTDLLLMPFLDGIYAFFWFTLPIKAYFAARRFSWRQLWLKFKKPTSES